MRIILLNLYYAPDEAATAQMLADLGSGLAAAGHEVRAICGDRAYLDPGKRYPKSESIGGVRVDRVSTTAFGRRSRIGRLIDYKTFFLGALRRLAFGPRFDVVVSLTTPPLIGLLGVAVARIRTRSNLTPRPPLQPGEGVPKAGVRSARAAGRPRSILWSMDVYPELAFRLGALRERSLLGRLISRLSRLTYRWSEIVVALGPTMARKLEVALASPGLAGPPSNITVIPNWADGEAIRPRPVERHPLRKEWGWENRFVVLYSGNLGLAHEFETVLRAADRLREGRSILFAFVGAGPRLSEVRRRSGELGLPNVEFRPPLPRARLSELLTAGDLHLATLRPEVVGLLVPSKIYGILSSGRPVLYVGPAEGEIFEIVDGKGCGAVVRNGDVDGVVRTVRAYAASPGRREIDGRRSREVFDLEFTRQESVGKWVELIEGREGVRA